jgi:hypothetical protein
LPARESRWEAREPAHSESARRSPSTARRRAGFQPHAELGQQRLAETLEHQQEGRAEQLSPVRILVGPDDRTLARWTRGFGKAREAAVPLRAGLVVLDRQQGFQGAHGTDAIGAVSFVPEQQPERVPGRLRDEMERALGNARPGEAGAIGCNGQAEPLVPEAIAPRERARGEVARTRRQQSQAHLGTRVSTRRPLPRRRASSNRIDDGSLSLPVGFIMHPSFGVGGRLARVVGESPEPPAEPAPSLDHGHRRRGAKPRARRVRRAEMRRGQPPVCDSGLRTEGPPSIEPRRPSQVPVASLADPHRTRACGYTGRPIPRGSCR